MGEKGKGEKEVYEGEQTKDETFSKHESEKKSQVFG